MGIFNHYFFKFFLSAPSSQHLPKLPLCVCWFHWTGPTSLWRTFQIFHHSFFLWFFILVISIGPSSNSLILFSVLWNWLLTSKLQRRWDGSLRDGNASDNSYPKFSSFPWITASQNVWLYQFLEPQMVFWVTVFGKRIAKFLIPLFYKSCPMFLD